MLFFWVTVLIQLMRCCCSHQGSCSFNSMCSCTSDQHDLNSRSIQDVSCISVPFYKFPSELAVDLALVIAVSIKSGNKIIAILDFISFPSFWGTFLFFTTHKPVLIQYFDSDYSLITDSYHYLVILFPYNFFFWISIGTNVYSCYLRDITTNTCFHFNLKLIFCLKCNAAVIQLWLPLLSNFPSAISQYIGVPVRTFWFVQCNYSHSIAKSAFA